MNRKCIDFAQSLAKLCSLLRIKRLYTLGLRGTVLLFCFLYFGLVQAEEMYLYPSVQLKTEYDDNKRLRSDSESNIIDGSAYGFIASATAKTGIRGDRYDVSLNNKLQIKRYESDYDLDSENLYLDLASSFNATQRSIFGLNGNYTRDTTLTSELEATGLVQENIVREQWFLSPYWTYVLSDTTNLQAGYTHYDTIYEQSRQNRFFDYTTDSVSLTLNQQWTELLQNFLSVSWMSFEVPELRRNTTQYTVNLGLNYQFLPTWSASLSIGRRFTNTEITFNQLVLINGFPVVVNGNLLTEEVTTSDDTQGTVFSFNLNKQFEAGSAGISYSRSTSAQGNGQLQLLDKFNANYSQNVTQNLRLSLNGGINVTSSSSSQNNNNDRTYYYISPSVSWLIDRNMRLTTGYRYRSQSFENRNGSAVSNAFYIGFKYQWGKMATQKF